MPRKGRALELLVARLEAVAAMGEAQVTSPDFILGKSSQVKREIDVSVRSKVGSTEVLVMFECRDRAGSEDVTWIEQIATKRDDVGASVAVAVTTAGFSAAAKNMASSKSIQLRTVSEITPEDVMSWCRLEHIDVHVVQTKAHNLSVSAFADMPQLVSVSPLHRLDDLSRTGMEVPFATLWDVRSSTNNSPVGAEWLTGSQLHQMGLDMAQESGKMPDAADWTAVAVTISSQESPRVAVNTIHGLFPLAEVRAEAMLRVSKHKCPVSLQEVAGEGGSKTQVVSAEAVFEGQKMDLSFTQTDDGIVVTLQIAEDETPGEQNDSARLLTTGFSVAMDVTLGSPAETLNP